MQAYLSTPPQRVSTDNEVDRLKERVMDVRKARLEKPWPPNDRQVGVILVAHSMG